MAVMELWRRLDLEGAVKPEYIDGNFFTQDSVGNLVGVKVYKDGAEVTLTGSVTGYCVLPSGETVSVVGTRSGNQASILVPQSALAYTGPLGIVLKLIDGNTITTLMSIIVVVYRSKTDTVITPSSQIITDWANQISAAMQDVADASAAQDVKIADLKSAFHSIFAGTEESYETGWVQGTIGVGTGKTGNSTTRCRNTTYLKGSDIGSLGFAHITVKSGYKLSVRMYNQPDLNVSGAYEGVPYSDFKDGEVEFEVNPDWYYRLVIGTTGDSEITPADVPADVIKFTVYDFTDKTLQLEGKAADALAVGTPLIALSDKGSIMSDWTQGGISVTTGKTGSQTNRCRNRAYLYGADLFCNGRATILVKDGYAINMVAYNKPDMNADGAFVGGLFDAFQPHNVVLTEGASNVESKDLWYRIIVARADNADITPADLPEDVVMYYQHKREKSGTVRSNSYGNFVRVRFTVSTNLANYGDSENVESVRCILQLPENYKACGKPVPLIMIGHGGTGFVSDSAWTNSANFNAMVDYFCAAGYALFDVNNTTGATGTTVADEGCLTLMQSYITAWQFIREKYNVSDDLFILSNSMGTFAAMNMLKWYGAKVRTAILSAPRVSLEETYGRMSADQKTHMANVFSWPSGITNYADAIQYMYGWDNYLDMYEDNGVKKVNRQFPPIKVMVGTADTNQLTQVRDYFAALKRSGNVVMYSETSGATHDVMSYLTTDALKTDALGWFERFRL